MKFFKYLFSVPRSAGSLSERLQQPRPGQAALHSGLHMGAGARALQPSSTPSRTYKVEAESEVEPLRVKLALQHHMQVAA